MKDLFFRFTFAHPLSIMAALLTKSLSYAVGMSTMEPQSDQRGRPGSLKHAVDFPVAAVGDLHPGRSAQGFGVKRRDRVEPRYPDQRATARATAATVGLRYTRLPTAAS